MLYYVVVFVVLLGVELLYFRVANYFNIIDKPNERSSHSRITLRGGGIVFYVGALVYFVISGFSFPWFMLGLTLIAGVSFVDDVRSVTQRVRLVVHFMAMLLLSLIHISLITEEVELVNYAEIYGDMRKH